ncbi:MAG TPA: NAD-dependent epimerase/dehydratase family protein [Thermoleophilaceae bacterium]|nr:NAD-dependent epimerase/dehydratase family protein [Thermoleophilaceae bacterium]
MRALVTGAAGFIGRHVAAALLDAGAEVRGFDLRAADGARDGFEPIAGDILDRDALVKALDHCDAVFHLAALYSYNRSDAARMRAVNVDGTRALLDAVARMPTRPRVVYTSSCATCGPVAGRAANEGDGPPSWELVVPYKRSKLDAERLALDAAAAGQDVVVVNPTTPVGPGDDRPTPTGKMVRDVVAGKAPAYLAGSVLNIVAVQDVARSHVRAFERARAGQRYLLGGENMSMRDVFGAIARAAGRPAPRVALPWAPVYAAARAADALMRPLGREPRLLVLDEVRLARLPMAFDDAKARRELGHESRPGVVALAEAAVAVRQSAARTGLNGQGEH